MMLLICSSKRVASARRWRIIAWFCWCFFNVVREDVRASSAVSSALDAAGAVEKVGVVVSDERRLPKEASKASRGASTIFSIFLIN